MSFTNGSGNGGANPDILARIRKILAKTTEAGCTQEESSAAYAMASRLLADHNLTMADVPAGAAGDEGWSQVDVGSAENFGWQQNLGSNIIRKFFFVETILYQLEGKNVFRVFGKASNVETAHFIFTSLMRSFYQLWQDFRVESDCPASDQRIFITGVAAGFKAKLEDERKAEAAERDMSDDRPTGGTSIILASIAEKTRLAFEEAYPDARKGRGYSEARGSQSSFDAGVAQGRSLNLNRALGKKRA